MRPNLDVMEGRFLFGIVLALVSSVALGLFVCSALQYARG